ncbi:prephenate dehydrogenase/arogenate dehydrogenase family protein [Oligoflexia bacterium]|nr:prephenate dehydrogenase/arogenate dehydrogenase family protein [Oligoflexia bacterium]
MKIAIIGVGHMGSWLMGQFAEEHEVAVFDVMPKEELADCSVKWLASISELETFRPQMLINAVSLENTVALFEEVVGLLPPDCILVDVASVKSDFNDRYTAWNLPFVSVHPMFGPTFADMDSLREESSIIIRESDEQGKKFFVDLFAHLGIKVFEYSFSEHDQMMAYALTTPFVASLVFAGCVDNKTVPGTTFKRHRLLAEGLLAEDDHLLTEVLFNPSSIAQLDKITNKLEFLKHVIRAKDSDEAKEYFAALRKNMFT